MMMSRREIDPRDLDRHITGNYGQDWEDRRDFDDDDDMGERLIEERADAMLDALRDGD